MGYEKFTRMGFLEMGNEKFLRIGSEKILGNNYKKISSTGQTPATVRYSYQEFLHGESFPGSSWESLQFLSTFSPDFPVKEFLRIPGKDS